MSSPYVPLSRFRLFELVCEEVFRDGVVETSENELLKTLARFLRLDDDQALQLARRALGRFKKGELGEAGPLDASGLFTRVILEIVADGKVDPGEEQMFSGLRKVLRLPGGESAATADSGRSLIERSLELATRADDGELTPGHVQDALELAARALDLGRPLGSGNSGCTVVLNVAAILAAGGKLHELEGFIRRSYAIDGSEDGAQAHYATLLTSCCDEVLKRCPAQQLIDVVAMAGRVARDGARPFLWAGLAALCGHAAALLGSKQLWKLHGQVLAALDEVPAGFQDTVLPHRVRALREWVGLALRSGDSQIASVALTALESLYRSRGSPLVTRELVRGLGLVIRARQIAAPADQPVAEYLRMLELAVTLEGDRETAVLLSGTAPDVLPELLQGAAADTEASARVLELIRSYASAWREDSEVLRYWGEAVGDSLMMLLPRWMNRDIDRLTAGASALTSESARADDPLMAGLIDTLALIASAAPGMDPEKQTLEKFEKLTGIQARQQL